MALTQEQKDARKAERINAANAAAAPLFAFAGLLETVTGEDVAAKRARDRESGRARIERVEACRRWHDEQADVMRAVWTEFAGPCGAYLAELRERHFAATYPSCTYRWGFWEKHLHSIGVVAVGVTEDGGTIQVTAERPAGVGVFEGLIPASAAMMEKKKR